MAVGDRLGAGTSTRRLWMVGVGASLAAACTTRGVGTVRAALGERIERQVGGRLGFCLVDSAGRVLASYRGGERFALCSTFKALLAAAVLERSDLPLDREIRVSADDLVAYAPVVEKAVAGSGRLTVAALCAGAVQWSDNGAANILLREIGGPAGLTASFRRWGDPISRLDRYEPELNENRAGDPRDTTTPQAVARLLARLLDPERHGAVAPQLRAWMAGSRTGAGRIRAGLPAGWAAGNKTGTAGGEAPMVCDLAWIESPPPAPTQRSILAVSLDRPAVPRADAEAAIADLTRALDLPGMPR